MEKAMGGLSRGGSKAKRRSTYFTCIGGCRRVNNERLRTWTWCMGNKTALRASVVSRSDACGCAFRGFRKENYSDVVSKVCYPRCTGTVDRAHFG